MKFQELNHDAWKQLVKNKYTIQMHGARNHDVEKAAHQVSDAGVRLLGEDQHVARVRAVTKIFRPDETLSACIVKLNTGAAVKLEDVVDVGDTVLIEVDQFGVPRIVQIIDTATWDSPSLVGAL